MGQLVLLVVAAAWAAVLVPPLLRSRIENRPNSSVTDFRNQLSSLQRAMPSRSVTMRSMARPLAPSPLSRPAATGRPAMRSGVRTHGGSAGRISGASAPARNGRPEPRIADASLRPRSHGGRTTPDGRPQRGAPRGSQISARDAIKRRRANVLFVLVLVAGCSLFLAATTKAEAMFYVFGLTFTALCGYVYVLGQLRQREQYDGTSRSVPSAQATRAPESRPSAARPPAVRPPAVRPEAVRVPVARVPAPRPPVARIPTARRAVRQPRQLSVRTHADRWSHAV